MIPAFDYLRGLAPIREELLAAAARVLDSGRLILGPEVAAFEQEFAAAAGSGHAVGVNSGTDALILALRALEVGPGDEVVTVPNTAVPTVAAIRAVGALPRFVDVDPGTLLMDVGQVAAAIGPQTGAIVPVHLFGHPVRMDALLETAGRHGIPVVEDCAQAHGATFAERPVGTFGTIGCFSFYPTKNLGAFGDGGACVTDDPRLAERLRMLRMYGFRGDGIAHVEGLNSRLDELQAAFLRVRLKWLPDAVAARRTVAARYRAGLAETGFLLPGDVHPGRHAYHLFVVRSQRRAALLEHLEQRGIGWGIHYAVPIPRMPAYAFLGHGPGAFPVAERAADEIVSLPMFPELSGAEVDKVVAALREFDEGARASTESGAGEANGGPDGRGGTEGRR